jgi:hypothetical protein
MIIWRICKGQHSYGLYSVCIVQYGYLLVCFVMPFFGILMCFGRVYLFFWYFPAHFLFVFFGFQGSELFFLLMNLNYHFFIICLTLPIYILIFLTPIRLESAKALFW